MSVKCPKCQAENPDTSSYCADCGTHLRSVRGTDPTDVGQDPRSGRPSDDIPIHTKSIETAAPQFAPGTSLSNRYEIIKELGRGGMGEVYLAEDTNLKRQVAIKVLPQPFALDKERLARFEREARLLASLNHPNIATIYGLEKSEDQQFLVMELAEGETLAERILKGPLLLDEALEVCKQIAEGLESAHEKGIIHRDLKPSNVKATPEGKVKILDFGLAKAFQEEPEAADLSKSPTLTDQMTRPGVILGTAAYMSPEQAKGKSVDKRTDIWAFGVILYECLTGKCLFKGELISEMLASILKDEPDWNALPSDIPLSVIRILRRCLAKDPFNRMRDIGDARIEILDVMERGPDEPEAAARRPAFKRLGVYAAIFLLGIILSELFFSQIRSTKVAPVPGSLHFSGMLPEGEEIAPMFSPPLVFSPDGTQLIVNTGQMSNLQLSLLDLQSDFAPVVLEGTKEAYVPFFSPEGDSIGFVTRDQVVFQLKLETGVITRICDLPTRLMAGATWGPDDTIVLSVAGSGLLCLRPGTDILEAVTQLNLEEGESGHWWPDFLPDGRHVLFTIIHKDGHKPAVLDLKTGQMHTIGSLPRATCVRFLEPNKLVYADSGNLFAVILDMKKWAIVGEPVKMISGIYTYTTSGLPYFSISRPGSLVYCPGNIGESWNKLVLVDRDGMEKPLTNRERVFMNPNFSPDGTRVAVTEKVLGALGDIFVYEVSSGRATRVTTDGNAYWPRWTPDGRRITYGLGFGGIAWKPVLEEAEEDILWKGENPVPSSWHVDGDVLIFEQINPDTGSDIYSLSLGGEPEVIVGSRADEELARLSPNGNWLAYSSNESGRYEVYIRPFPGSQRGIPVSANGGRHPIWSSDGEHIYYMQGRRLMSLPVKTSPELVIGDPTVILENQFLTLIDLNTYSTFFDVSPDEKYFVMIQGEEKKAPIARYNIILNWSQEVEQRLKTSK